jgi:phage regulator Rha-like protein
MIELESTIFVVRGHRVILDSDLAALYGVSTKRLNEQIKRNHDRFPDDFMFQLEFQEVTSLRSQFATSKGGRRYKPYAFTEHGAVMAANVLNSKVAINASIMLVRTFIKMRMIFAEHADLKKRLVEIERHLAHGFAQHEEELQEIRFLISQLEKPLESSKRRLGFFKDGDG